MRKTSEEITYFKWCGLWWKKKIKKEITKRNNSKQNKRLQQKARKGKRNDKKLNLMQPMYPNQYEKRSRWKWYICSSHASGVRLIVDVKIIREKGMHYCLESRKQFFLSNTWHAFGSQLKPFPLKKSSYFYRSLDASACATNGTTSINAQCVTVKVTYKKELRT